MRLRMLITLFSLALCTVAVFFATPQKAAAAWNNPNCCGFTVEVKYVPATCFPLELTTKWNPGGGTNIISGNGIYTNLPILTGVCPPMPEFMWVSLNGGLTIAGQQDTKVLKTSTGCCVTVTTALDANGCVYITINGFTNSSC